jgi:ATP-dependent Clp protease adaptor protein ClpS
MSDKRKEQGDLATKSRDQVEEPRKFKVILLNDNYTSMEFVVHVLRTVFHHSPAQATRVMLHIHNSGVGVAGIYTRDVAETRIEQVHAMAREAGHPLMCEMEPE